MRGGVLHVWWYAGSWWCTWCDENMVLLGVERDCPEVASHQQERGKHNPRPQNVNEQGTKTIAFKHAWYFHLVKTEGSFVLNIESCAKLSSSWNKRACWLMQWWVFCTSAGAEHLSFLATCFGCLAMAASWDVKKLHFHALIRGKV